MTVYNPSGAGPQGYQVPSKQGPPHPATANEFAWNRVRNGDTHTIMHTQKFLGHHGFNVGVDGIWGPQTAHALKQYLNGHKPKVSNAPMQRYVPGKVSLPPQKAGKLKPTKGGKGGKG